ncbi:MAG: hypothetical protein EOO24_17900, partial [Comamonadaceae bacterium]
VLVVNPAKVSATNSREFIALLKGKPGALNFASGGNGTILHLAAELFLDASGTTARHIPYKGVGPMVTDLIGGQVDFGVVALPSVQGHIKSGALRPIGMMSAQRTQAAPDIATFEEQGLANFAVDAWFAVIGPKGLSPANVKKAHDAVVTAFADPAVKEAMAKQGNTINIGSTEQAQAAFRAELAKYAALVQKVGLEPQQGHCAAVRCSWRGRTCAAAGSRSSARVDDVSSRIDIRNSFPPPCNNDNSAPSPSPPSASGA